MASIARITDTNITGTISAVQMSYHQLRRMFDAMIQIYTAGGGDGGGGAAALATCINATPADAQTIYNALNAAMGGMTTAYNSLSPIDLGVV